MAMFFQKDEFGYDCIGYEVTVPNNDVARLMYYLSCVCVAIDCNNDPQIQRFINYNNWSYLSTEERKVLIGLCYVFSPDILNNRVFFHSDILCGNYNNQFFSINQVRSQLVASESILIAGQTRQVNKIMTYKIAWMSKNYLEPMQRLVRSLDTSSRSIPYRPTYTPPVVRQPSRATSSSTYSCARICFCIYCILFVIPGIIGIIIAIVNANRK